jgi:hypothetical protein
VQWVREKPERQRVKRIGACCVSAGEQVCHACRAHAHARARAQQPAGAQAGGALRMWARAAAASLQSAHHGSPVADCTASRNDTAALTGPHPASGGADAATAAHSGASGSAAAAAGGSSGACCDAAAAAAAAEGVDRLRDGSTPRQWLQRSSVDGGNVDGGSRRRAASAAAARHMPAAALPSSLPAAFLLSVGCLRVQLHAAHAQRNARVRRASAAAALATGRRTPCHAFSLLPRQSD